MTPASSDPLVATLFAVWCRRHGSAVVLIVPLESVKDFDTTQNVHAEQGSRIADAECEIAVPIAPSEFAKLAIMTLDVDVASKILVEMGIPVASVIADTDAFKGALVDTQKDGI